MIVYAYIIVSRLCRKSVFKINEWLRTHYCIELKKKRLYICRNKYATRQDCCDQISNFNVQQLHVVSYARFIDIVLTVTRDIDAILDVISPVVFFNLQDTPYSIQQRSVTFLKSLTRSTYKRFLIFVILY